jgi:hypothetical protein
VLELVIVDLEATGRRVRPADTVLRRRQDATSARRNTLQEGHHDVGAHDELLDEHAVGILHERLGDALSEPVGVVNHRVGYDPLGASFEVRLDDHREAKIGRQ